MLPNWLYGKSKSKLASILGGGGGIPEDYNQVKAQVTQNAEDILLLSDALDGKAALTQISNPNILDNPWFTINQRGQSSYSTTGANYTFDRWYSYEGDTSVVQNSDGSITLGAVEGVTKTVYLRQKIENTNKLLGRTLTISLLKDDGTIVTATGDVPSTVPTTQTDVAIAYIKENDLTIGTISITFLANSYLTASIAAYAGASLTIRAVKLEVGSISTLAMDVAPDYTIELIKCKHYFQVFTGDLGRAMTVLANRIQFNVPLPIRLYSSPTVTATPRIFNLDTTEVTGFTFSYSAINNYQTLRINADKTAHGLTDAYVNAGTEKLYISAEL